MECPLIGRSFSACQRPRGSAQDGRSQSCQVAASRERASWAKPILSEGARKKGEHQRANLAPCSGPAGAHKMGVANLVAPLPYGARKLTSRLRAEYAGRWPASAKKDSALWARDYSISLVIVKSHHRWFSSSVAHSPGTVAP